MRISAIPLLPDNASLLNPIWISRLSFQLSNLPFLESMQSSCNPQNNVYAITSLLASTLEAQRVELLQVLDLLDLPIKVYAVIDFIQSANSLPSLACCLNEISQCSSLSSLGCKAILQYNAGIPTLWNNKRFPK